MSDDEKEAVQLVKVVSDWAPEPLKLYAETLHGETRLLLTEGFRRIDGDIANLITTRSAMMNGINERFAHQQAVFENGQATAQRAVDKAEAAQSAHNVAANEWRNTLNDFKSTLISKSEFDRLASEFSAYRLEQSRLMSLTAGEKTGAKETKDESRAGIATVIGIAVGVATLISILVGAFIRPPTPIVAAPAVQQQMQVPQGYSLVPNK